MKKAAYGDAAGAKHSGAAASAIVAPCAARNPDLDSKEPPSQTSSSPCPYGAECRQKWTYLVGTETADCAHCYQNLNRSEMARIMENL